MKPADYRGVTSFEDAMLRLGEIEYDGFKVFKTAIEGFVDKTGDSRDEIGLMLTKIAMVSFGDCENDYVWCPEIAISAERMDGWILMGRVLFQDRVRMAYGRSVKGIGEEILGARLSFPVKLMCDHFIYHFSGPLFRYLGKINFGRNEYEWLG